MRLPARNTGGRDRVLPKPRPSAAWAPPHGGVTARRAIIEGVGEKNGEKKKKKP